MLQSRSALVQRAIQIAQGKHGVAMEGQNPQNNTVVDQNPVPTIQDVADAIKKLSQHKKPDSTNSTKARSLCNILANHHHLVPSQALKNTLEKVWLDTKANRRHWLSGSDAVSYESVKRMRRWTEKEISARLGVWQEVGVSTGDLLALVKKARFGKQKPTKEEYYQVLKVCLYLLQSTHGSGPCRLNADIQALIELMVLDVDLETTQQSLPLAAFDVSFNEQQLQSIFKTYSKSQQRRNVIFNHRQFEACLQTDLAKTSFTVLTRYLVSQDVPLTMDVFERVLSLCARQGFISNAVSTYTCMVRRHNMAPSERVYSILTNLLSRTPTRNTIEFEQLCHKIVSDTVTSFGGLPPLWVYTYMTRPLLRVMGKDAYELMYDRSLEAVADYCKHFNHDKRMEKELLQHHWNQDIYHSLLMAAGTIGSPSLALHLLKEMRINGVLVTATTYRLMFELVTSQSSLNDYLPVLLADVGKYASRASLDFKSHHTDKTRHRDPSYSSPWYQPPISLSAAARKHLNMSVVQNTHQECIKNLKDLALLDMLRNPNDTSTEPIDEHDGCQNEMKRSIEM